MVAQWQGHCSSCSACGAEPGGRKETFLFKAWTLMSDQQIILSGVLRRTWSMKSNANAISGYLLKGVPKLLDTLAVAECNHRLWWNNFGVYYKSFLPAALTAVPRRKHIRKKRKGASLWCGSSQADSGPHNVRRSWVSPVAILWLILFSPRPSPNIGSRNPGILGTVSQGSGVLVCH